MRQGVRRAGISWESEHSACWIYRGNARQLLLRHEPQTQRVYLHHDTLYRQRQPNAVCDLIDPKSAESLFWL
jgi:hypothetical protein